MSPPAIAGQRAAGLAAEIMCWCPVSPTAIISAYWPVHDEIDPLPLLDRLCANGARAVLPEIVGKGRPLRFRRFVAGDILHPGPLGIMQPDPQAEILTPDWLIVPLLAFNRLNGARLGHGGGFYDRTLQELRSTSRPVVIGIGYSAQNMPRLPMTRHDQFLDAIVHDSGFIAFQDGGGALLP